MKKTFKIERILSDTGILFHCSNTRDLKLERTTEEDLRYHLYIISDDEIKEGDYFIHNNQLFQCGFIAKYINADGSIGITIADDSKQQAFEGDTCKKIVATTDKSIDEYIPGNRHHALPDSPKSHSIKFIPESFIKAYIKAYNEGKPITEVDLEMIHDFSNEIAGYEYDNGLILKTRPDNTVIIFTSKDYWKQEMEKCIESPYYFYTKYCMINGKKAITLLSEKEFNELWMKNGKI